MGATATPRGTTTEYGDPSARLSDAEELRRRRRLARRTDRLRDRGRRPEDHEDRGPRRSHAKPSHARGVGARRRDDPAATQAKRSIETDRRRDDDGHRPARAPRWKASR